MRDILHPIMNPDKFFEQHSLKAPERPTANPTLKEIANALNENSATLREYIFSAEDPIYEALLDLYALIQHLIEEEGTDEKSVTMIRNKFKEEPYSCSPGLFNRIQEALESLPADANMPALLANKRKDLWKKMCFSLRYSDTHYHEEVRTRLNNIGAAIPVFYTDRKDKYGLGNLKREFIEEKGKRFFHLRYSPSFILETLFDSSFYEREYSGYKDPKTTQTEDSYSASCLKRTTAFYAKTLGIDKLRYQDFFILDDEYYPYSIKMSRVISETIQYFFDNGYFKALPANSLTPENTCLYIWPKTDLFDSLIQFQKQSGETIQFFLRNAKHFSFSSNDALDTTYMLTKDEQNKIIESIHQSQHLKAGIKKAILAFLAESGFSVNQEYIDTQLFFNRLETPLDLKKALALLPEKHQKNNLLNHFSYEELANLTTLTSLFSHIYNSIIDTEKRNSYFNTTRSLVSDKFMMNSLLLARQKKYDDLLSAITDIINTIDIHTPINKRGDTAIIATIVEGYTDSALYLINMSTSSSINRTNKRKQTALSFSVMHNRTEVTQALLQKGGALGDVFSMKKKFRKKHSKIIDRLASFSKEQFEQWAQNEIEHYKQKRRDDANKKKGKFSLKHRNSLFGLSAGEKFSAINAFTDYIQKPSLEKFQILQNKHSKALHNGRLYREVIKPYLSVQAKRTHSPRGLKKRYGESTFHFWCRAEKSILSHQSQDPWSDIRL